MFEHRYLIQRIGVEVRRAAVLFHSQHGALLRHVVAAAKGIEGGSQVFGRHVGQKTQMPRIDTQNGDARASKFGRSA